jgi:hypothetical protein
MLRYALSVVPSNQPTLARINHCLGPRRGTTIHGGQDTLQDETVRGNTPAAAPGAIAPGVRLCVACLHENRSGEQSCEACGTSLHLILCGACEAANDLGALRCHACGAALGIEAGDKPALAPPASPTSLARTEAGSKPAAVPSAAPMSLARTEASDKQAAASPVRRTNRARLALILAAVVVTTAGFAYHYFPRTGKTDRSQHGGVIQVAPVKLVEPPVRVSPPGTAAKTRAPAAAPKASVGPAPKAGPAHTPVTHTRPTDTSSTPPPAAVARSVPDASQKSEAGCGEAVAALGLCNVSAKSGGQ